MRQAQKEKKLCLTVVCCFSLAAQFNPLALFQVTSAVLLLKSTSNLIGPTLEACPSFPNKKRHKPRKKRIVPTTLDFTPPKGHELTGLGNDFPNAESCFSRVGRAIPFVRSSRLWYNIELASCHPHLLINIVPNGRPPPPGAG